MNEPVTYVVLGAGRQGTAAGYDMGRWGGAGKVVMADANPAAAQASAGRINRMLERDVAEACQVDVENFDQVRQVLEGAAACLSAVPYRFNLELAKIAVEQKVNWCDLGGNTDIVREQHKLAEQAKAAGISVIPNCGQVPGMGTSLVAYAIEQLDEAQDVYMWDGGLPQHPKPPFNYLLTFHIAGLTNEYAEPGVFLREGKVTLVEPMTELEEVDFPEPIGKLEAFVTGGGTDTMPWTYEGKLRTLQNLTLRYPGHFTQLRAFYDLGLWDQEPVDAEGVLVSPRSVFHALYEPKVVHPEEKDLIIIRVKVLGKKDGKPAESYIEVIDYYDEATGFTAMERGTGWPAAIVAEMMARGETPRGAGGVHEMVPAGKFVEEIIQRGIPVTRWVK